MLMGVTNISCDVGLLPLRSCKSKLHSF